MAKRRDDDFCDDDSIDSPIIDAILKGCKMRPILKRQKTEEFEQDLNVNDLSGIVEGKDARLPYKLTGKSLVVEFSCACISAKETHVIGCSKTGSIYLIPLVNSQNTKLYANYLISVINIKNANDIYNRSDLVIVSSDAKLFVLRIDGSLIFEYEFKGYESGNNIAYRMVGPRIFLPNSNISKVFTWWTGQSHFLYFSYENPFKLVSRFSLNMRGKVKPAITSRARSYCCCDVKKGLSLVAFCDDRQDVYCLLTGPGGKGDNLEEAKLVSLNDPNSVQIKGISMTKEGFIILILTKSGPAVDIYALKQTRAVFYNRTLLSFLTPNTSNIPINLSMSRGKLTYGKQVLPSNNYDLHLSKGVRGSSNYPLKKPEPEKPLNSYPEIDMTFLSGDMNIGHSLAISGTSVITIVSEGASIKWKKIEKEIVDTIYESIRIGSNNFVGLAQDFTIQVKDL